MITVQMPSAKNLRVDELEPKTAYLCIDDADGEKIIGITDENRCFIVFHSANGGYDAGYNLTHHIDEFYIKDQYIFDPVNLEIKVSFK